MSDQSLLSERELEVLQLIANGASNNEIAQRLVISPNTVKVHVRNIYSKLGVVSRTEASMEALRQGLIIVPGVEASDDSSAVNGDEPLVVPDVVTVIDEQPASVALPDEAIPEPLIDVVPVAAMAPVAQPSPRHVAVPHTLAWAALAVVVLLIGVLAWLAVRSPASSADATPPPAMVRSGWSEVPSLPQPVADAAGVLLNENTSYVIGGTTDAGVSDAVYRFGPNGWQVLAAKPTAVAHVSAALIGSNIYVPGGVQQDGTLNSSLEIYDINDDSWSSGPVLPEGRADYALAAIDGNLYIFGGRTAAGPTDSTLVLRDPGSDGATWTKAESLPQPLQSAALAQRGSDVYLIGGITTGDQPSLATYRYSLGRWEQRTDLPEPRVAGAAAFVGSRIYLVGGGATTLPVLVYQNNTWSADALDTGHPLSRQVMVSDGDRLYIFGGAAGATLLSESRSWQPANVIFIPNVQR